MHKVSSEIYKETNFQPIKGTNDKVISKFKFHYPPEDEDHDISTITDKDGDLIVCRRPPWSVIEIEHSEATELRLVGLQVWRGALLLADFLFHRRKDFSSKQILELGAGVGLTSIAAAFYARKVICTDVDIGGILNLIRGNVERNRKLFKANNVNIMEYDFMQSPDNFAPELLQAIDESDVVVAADVIYDDTLTDAFIRVIDKIFERAIESRKPKTIYVALEKRFVFTLADCDSVAPMYEYFLKQATKKSWHFQFISIDFPQYFDYERCKQLVLISLTSNEMT